VSEYFCNFLVILVTIFVFLCIEKEFKLSNNFFPDAGLEGLECLSFLVEPKDTVVSTGGDAVLDCVARARPHNDYGPPRISWKKDGSLIHWNAHNRKYVSSFLITIYLYSRLLTRIIKENRKTFSNTIIE